MKFFRFPKDQSPIKLLNEDSLVNVGKQKSGTKLASHL